MEPQAIISADYLDIVFDNRNKQYGGYLLRKFYTQRMLKGVTIILGLATILSAFSLLRDKEHIATAGSTIAMREIRTSDAIFEAPKLKPKPKPATLPATIKPPRPTTAFTMPAITNDTMVTTPAVDPGDLDPGKMTTTGDANGTSIDLPKAPGNTVTAPAIDKPMFIADEMPVFNGDITRYLATHLSYPERAREAGIDGKVIIQFIVNENGDVIDARILRGIGGGCDEEALRVVKNMPRWKPGRQNGQPVKIYYTLPVMFMLQ